MTEHDHNDLEFDSQLREELRDEIPPDVERRLRNRLDAIRNRFEEDPQLSISAETTPHRRKMRAVSIVGFAVCLVLVAVLFFNLPRVQAWADVVQSVQKQSWIRCRGTRPDGGRMEFWFSLSKPKRALFLRFGDVELVSQVDFERLERVTYRKQDGQIVRKPLPKIDKRDLGLATEFLAELAPFKEMLNALNEDSRLVSQTQTEITENGETWIRYQLVFEETHGPHEQFVDAYLVKPSSDLPQWWIRSSMDGKKELRFRIDYPETGPKDIFDLGVPRPEP